MKYTYNDNIYIIYTTTELKSQQKRGKKCFTFSSLVGNSYGSVQHVVQYASPIVAHYLHTDLVTTAHTSWLPLVACYHPANVNTSCQTSALCC